MGEWLLSRKGLSDGSQARSAFAPKGLKDSAQVSKPGKPANKRHALKGRETIR